MTYSCALFEEPDRTLEAAQWAKLELVCGKLGLGPGMRLLDVGCGWGSLVRHAARHHGVEAVGVTFSVEQAAWARASRWSARGCRIGSRSACRTTARCRDGPFDAISSIGMSEHVGGSELANYFRKLRTQLAPEGRLLNHAITRPSGLEGRGTEPGRFISRYVFPDAALVEVGEVITALQSAGLEAVHMESLREHYALTLRAWVDNLERNWDRCAEEGGLARARIWRLYMAGSVLGFEDARIGVAQVLATHLGSSSVPLRPDWTPAPVVPADPFGGSDRRRTRG